MRLWTVCLLVPALIAEAHAADARIRTAAYDPDGVYALRGVVGYQIDLEFEIGETFTGLGAGDIEALSFVGRDNHLFLKPKAEHVATNLTVLTNRRRYLIEYNVAAHTGEAVTYAVRFSYPATPGSSHAAQIDNEFKAATATRPRNINYWYCGEPTLKPVAASDDGVHTRLSFAANAELPAVFVRNDDGSESLLNFSMDAGDLVIHRVARRYVLRRGALRGCIVNQGYQGGGSRLDSGTVAAGVQRRVEGVQP